MYQITWNGSSVGNAELHKEGMFYRFLCRCRLPNKGLYRVIVTDGENKYDLGICVPEGNGYSCVARVPCNQLKGNNLSFALMGSEEKRGITIASGKPFAHLDKLNAARLHFANGLPEIMINPIQDQQDSDLSQTHQNK